MEIKEEIFQSFIDELKKADISDWGVGKYIARLFVMFDDLKNDNKKIKK